MRGAGEAFGIIATLAGSWALIEFIDWVGRNKAEALREDTGLETHCPEGLKTRAQARAGERKIDPSLHVTGAHRSSCHRTAGRGG